MPAATLPLPLLHDAGRSARPRLREAVPAHRAELPAIPPMSQDSPSGLEAVFLASRPQLLRFLRARGAGDTAEDLLHELWIKLSAQGSGPIAQPLAYLYRAANNLMVDQARSRRQAVSRDQAWTEATGSAVDRSDAPGADRVLLARDALRGAQAVLDALGERPATVFRRYRIDGAAQRDIAQELGVSLSTVESDLRRAYRALIEWRRTHAD
jgi:RNA polymerase sigma factor (sigma-70 family)